MIFIGYSQHPSKTIAYLYIINLLLISFCLISEMIAVEELHRDSAVASRRPIIVFNGELDRIRSGCILPCALG